MRDFEGALQAYAYSGFHHLYDDGAIYEVACWAENHAYGECYGIFLFLPIDRFFCYGAGLSRYLFASLRRRANRNAHKIGRKGV
jgi:hypothetical protein